MASAARQHVLFEKQVYTAHDKGVFHGAIFGCCLQILDSFQRQLSGAGSGDMVLMIATIARLGHIPRYIWVEEVVETWGAERLTTFTPKQLSTVRYCSSRHICAH